MLCKGVIKEQNKERACWLPADSSSQFQLCRRCHFHRVTNILDSLSRNYALGDLHPPYEILFNDVTFLNEILHPAREQALLNCLSVLFNHNKIQFQHALQRLQQKTVFSIILTKRIETHSPSSKCKMYMFCMENSRLYTSKNSCWNCWSCLALLLRRKKPHLVQQFSENFLFNYRRLTQNVFQQVGYRTIADIFSSLYFLNKKHFVLMWMEWLLVSLPLDMFKTFILIFLQQPSMYFLLFEQKEKEVLPLAFQEKVVVEEYKRTIKNIIKERNDLLKKELVEKTWHPSRLFPWCLDIEDWKDFGISSSNCHIVYRDFLLDLG